MCIGPYTLKVTAQDSMCAVLTPGVACLPGTKQDWAADGRACGVCEQALFRPGWVGHLLACLVEHLLCNRLYK
jgi:hypothetical protein